ncbi:ribonuclease Z [Desulfothermus sp.]
MGQKKIVVLGTASQVPTTFRNHVGLFLRWENEDFLFDPGEGTQRQLIRFKVPINRIKKIFISHFHGDHCLGLPGIIQRLSLNQIKHPVEIIYPKQGEVFVKNLINAAVFHNNLELIFCPIDNDGKITVSGDVLIHAYKLDHGIDCFGFRISDPPKWNIIPSKLPKDLPKEAIGELKDRGMIEFKGQRIFLQQVAVPKKTQIFSYVMDTRICDSAYKIADSADILVCESTYLSTEIKLAESYKHLTARQAAEIAKKSKAKKLILTHFSQRYNIPEVFEQEAKNIFKNTIAAIDGMEVKFEIIKRSV